MKTHNLAIQLRRRGHSGQGTTLPPGGLGATQYLDRSIHRSVGRGGDYTDDWHHGGQWLGHRRKRRRRGRRSRGRKRRRRMGNNARTRRGRGGHDNCWRGWGHQGSSRCGCTELRVGGRGGSQTGEKSTRKNKKRGKKGKEGEQQGQGREGSEEMPSKDGKSSKEVIQGFTSVITEHRAKTQPPGS